MSIRHQHQVYVERDRQEEGAAVKLRRHVSKAERQAHGGR